MRGIRFALVAGVAGAMLLTTPLTAEGQQNPLPDDVRSWLEQDQVRRWAMMIQTGDSLFNSGSCMRCHGEAGTGGRNGPDLTDADWVQSDGSLEEIRRTVFWGVRREHLSEDSSWRFEMNPGGGLDLEWTDYQALAAYVWSLSNGTYLPGR